MERMAMKALDEFAALGAGLHLWLTDEDKVPLVPLCGHSLAPEW